MWKIKEFIKAWMEYPKLKDALNNPYWAVIYKNGNRFEYAKEMVRAREYARKYKVPRLVVSERKDGRTEYRWKYTEEE